MYIALSQLRSAILRLSLLQKFPHDIVPEILYVFQTSSVSLHLWRLLYLRSPRKNRTTDVFCTFDLQRKIEQQGSTYQNILTLTFSTYQELVGKQKKEKPSLTEVKHKQDTYPIWLSSNLNKEYIKQLRSIIKVDTHVG